ncbi:MAG: hypothetical protein GF309_16360 [Candidatus Lokiarchaeota archaeon]|nr:hypothetical protein [Candidatus Lokiarchaeota archaeon]
MEIDSGVEPEPSGPQRRDFSVSWTGMVSRTFALWKRRLPSYLTIMGITSLAVYGLYSVVLILLLGPSGVGILPYIGTSPFSLITSLAQLGSLSMDQFIVLVPMTIISMVIYAVAGGAAIKLAFDDYGEPGRGDVDMSLSYSFGKAWSLIGAQIIVGLVLLILQIPTLLTFVFMLTGDIELIAIASLLSLVGMVLSAYIGTRLTPVSAVVIAEENTGAFGAVKRAWGLTSGNFWHIFGGQLLLGLVVGIITIIVELVIGMLTFSIAGFVGIVISTIIVGILFSSVDYIFQTVLYRDLESRAAESEEDWW